MSITSGERDTAFESGREGDTARAYRGAVPRLDYTLPKGDPGLLGPGSMGWKVSANPVVSAIGGIAAVILELSEKHVRAGVWDHSTFKVDPIRRMERTGMAAMAVTYGPAAMAEQTFRRVTRMHESVTGTTHDGATYRAMEPELLTWVHATASWGFLNAYKRYVDPALSREDETRYYREGEVIGKGFGADWVPTSADEMDAYMAEMTPKLYANETVQEFLTLVRDATPLGAAGKPLQRLVTQAAIDLLPEELQKQCGVAVSAAARLVVRPAMRALTASLGFAMRFAKDQPAHQACRRMGVSTDCLR